jgi:hypothetical protein
MCKVGLDVKFQIFLTLADIKVSGDLHCHATYPQRSGPWYMLNGSLCRPHMQSGKDGKVRNAFPVRN